MNNPVQPKNKIKPPVLIDPLISLLNNIQSKIDAAAGSATTLELRLLIIAQLEPKVQEELKKWKKPYCLNALINSVIEIFKNKLDLSDQVKIKSCHYPRNKITHGNFAELMIELNGEALGREIDPYTGKRKPLEKNDIIEGTICIERNHGLEDFSKKAKEAIEILDRKILRSLKP